MPSDPSATSPRFQRLAGAYRGVALLVLNSLLGLLVLNAGAAALLAWQERSRRARAVAGPSPAHQAHVDPAAYEGTPAHEVAEMLDDFTQLRARGFRHEPFVGFSEPPFESRHLNVELDAAGIPRRRVPEPAAPAAEELWFFGGSTAFGYHVADAATVPAHLQLALERTPRPLRVRNHGHAYFYSSQEVVLFQQLLRRSRPPAVAVFLDGLNDAGNFASWRDTPVFTDLTRDLWSISQSGRADDTVGQLLQRLALVRLVLGLRPPPEGIAPPLDEGTREEGDPGVVGREAAAMYLGNVRAAQALCAAYGVECHFFVQPTPFYGHDRSNHPGYPAASPWLRAVHQAFHTELAARPGDSVVLGHLLREYGAGRKVFVDDVHYNEPFARFLAARMAAALRR